MNPFLILLISLAATSAGISFCFWLLFRAREADTTVWILEHILCPIIRIVVLLIIVSLIYPATGELSSSVEFWRILGQQGQFNKMVNILFFASLALAFLPIVNHAVLSLPLLTMLSIALVFDWQYGSDFESLSLFPGAWTLFKILAYMALVYFVTRESSVYLSRLIDEKLAISGSIRLVSDSIYLLLQIPVMLIYCGFLQQQLANP